MHAATAVGMARFAATNILLFLACIAVNRGVAQLASRSDIDDLSVSSGSGDDSTSDTEDGDVEDILDRLKVKYIPDPGFDLCNSRYPIGMCIYSMINYCFTKL